MMKIFTPACLLLCLSFQNLTAQNSIYDIRSKASLWIGGINKADGNLKVAVLDYNRNDYKPGPIDTVNITYDSLASLPYKRTWEIDRKTIEEFKQNYNKSGYSIPEAISSWPAHGTGNFSRQLAPFVDTDGNRIYEPSKGDYPALKGDHMLWWIFNDGGRTGVEVHATAYAYYYRDLPDTDSNNLINKSSFLHYKIINTGYRYDNYYTGLFNDDDIGFYGNDYIGCNVGEHTAYTYDDTAVLFCKLLNGSMSSVMSINDDFNPVNGSPNKDADYYNYLKGNWKNGNSLTYGGVGAGGPQPAKFMYSCNTDTAFPGQEWTEASAGNTPGERRYIVAQDPVSALKWSVMTLDAAYIYLKDPDNISGCDRGLPELKRVQRWYDNNSFPSKPYYGAGIADIKDGGSFKLYPNPSSSKISITGTSEITAVQVMDITGKTMISIVPAPSPQLTPVTIDMSDYPMGIYLVKISSKNGTVTKKAVKQL